MKLVIQLWDGKGDDLLAEDAVHLPNDLGAVLTAGPRASWPPAAPGWIAHLAPPDGAGPPARPYLRWRIERCTCLPCQATAAPPEVPRRYRARRGHRDDYT